MGRQERPAALLAESEALRAKNEAADKTITKQFAWAASKAHRASEAERKLAEAVGLLTRWLNTRGEMSGAGTVETATSTFLSKEAEQ